MRTHSPLPLFKPGLEKESGHGWHVPALIMARDMEQKKEMCVKWSSGLHLFGNVYLRWLTKFTRNIEHRKSY